jgi:hypothetical protein
MYLHVFSYWGARKNRAYSELPPTFKDENYEIVGTGNCIFTV